MPIIHWSDEFLLNVQQFDEHHRHLVALLNKTYDQFISDTSRKNTGDILDELVDYATYHFAAEEHWMTENSYPRLAEHRSEHDRFSHRVVEMQNDPRNVSPLELLSFINNWLKNHILRTDADYGLFHAETVNRRGITIKLD